MHHNTHFVMFSYVQEYYYIIKSLFGWYSTDYEYYWRYREFLTGEKGGICHMCGPIVNKGKEMH